MLRHNTYSSTTDFYAYKGGLIQIEKKISILIDKNLRDFGLPSPNRSQNAIVIILCRTYDVNELSLFVDSYIPKLVAYQKIAFDNIIEKVENNSDGRLFF